MLAEILSSASVPEDLVYFRDGGRNLVVNPELGAWHVLDHSELDILSALANDEPLAGRPQAERTLAKLVMDWVIYLPGKRPALR